MATFPAPNAAVLAARARRGGADAARNVRIEWLLENVLGKIRLPLRQRMDIAVEHLRSTVVRNISTPVVKGRGPLGGYVVTGRSHPGEFPHAETTQLLKTIFVVVTEEGPYSVSGHVGTPLDYGLILEVVLDRSFLVRSLTEEHDTLVRILTGPIGPNEGGETGMPPTQPVLPQEESPPPPEAEKQPPVKEHESPEMKELRDKLREMGRQADEEAALQDKYDARAERDVRDAIERAIDKGEDWREAARRAQQ